MIFEKFSIDQIDAAVEMMILTQSYKDDHLLTTISQSPVTIGTLEDLILQFSEENIKHPDKIEVNLRKLLLSSLLLGYSLRKTLIEKPKNVF